MEENKNKRYVYGALIIISVALIALGGSYLVAKYIHIRNNEGSVKTQNFYFSSNLLDGELHTLNAGRTEIGFKLGNHGDDLRSADMDVTYTVTVEKTAGSGEKTPSLTPASGTIPGGTVGDAEITLSDLEPGCTYTVKAIGKGGYHKTLTATITVPAQEETVYKNVDASDSSFVILTVWAEGYKGTVTITPKDEALSLIPDNTDPRMNDVITGSSFSDEVSFKNDWYASHKYLFFGTGVTAEDFDVKYVNAAGVEMSAEERMLE